VALVPGPRGGEVPLEFESVGLDQGLLGGEHLFDGQAFGMFRGVEGGAAFQVSFAEFQPFPRRGRGEARARPGEPSIVGVDSRANVIASPGLDCLNQPTPMQLQPVRVIDLRPE
jgi:hypothetical protein